jgi:hypothetical protein
MEGDGDQTRPRFARSPAGLPACQGKLALDPTQHAPQCLGPLAQGVGAGLATHGLARPGNGQGQVLHLLVVLLHHVGRVLLLALQLLEACLQSVEVSQ